ncbi:MAG TPA: NUDIX domain-containing protein [Blastocatellia bacterium]|jgi:ADP-ribose pyrophosphatase YjhB (NUDIX family)|nr:NUDIX domain-containing protein [Blastocatellia bacterium]
MLKKVLGLLWRRAPKRLRRLGVYASESRFTVTAGAVVIDREGRVLLLKHVFRAGSGLGIPGGFISKGEQPEEAIRRELREEVDLEIEEPELAFVRTQKHINQVEIIFLCRPSGPARTSSFEIKTLGWFALDSLPRELSRDQRSIIARALNHRPAS